MKRFVSAPSAKQGLLLAAVLLLSATPGCGKDDSAPAAHGTARLAVAVPESANIASIHYTISGNGITPLSDTVTNDVQTLSGLPQGLGYLVELSATSSDGHVSCSGTSSFDISVDVTTQVNVVMHCTSNDVNTGGVQVNDRWCPVLSAYTATPTSVPVGSQISAVANAIDLDTSDDATPTFLWTATSGTFASATSAATKYTCTAVGTQTLTITIGASSPTVDVSSCADSRTTTVTCTQPPSLCGNGVVDPGEDCDPPNTAATSYATGCDASCHSIAALCGTCEASKCDALFGQTGAWGCAGLTGAAQSNCQTLLSCIRSSHCAQATGNPQACYCGTASDAGCLGGSANGACKAQYEAAAGTTDASTIASLLSDPSSPVGLVDNEITCDADTSAPLCTSACPL